MTSKRHLLLRAARVHSCFAGVHVARRGVLKHERHDMKKILILTIGLGALVSLTGCVNGYTRCPGTRARVESIYQSTRTAGAASVICAFPQMMSDAPSDYRFMALNLLTIPLGVAVLADAMCEAAVDTVCLPADLAIAKCREKEEEP